MASKINIITMSKNIIIQINYPYIQVKVNKKARYAK